MKYFYAYDKDLCILIFKSFFKSDSGSNIWRFFKSLRACRVQHVKTTKEKETVEILVTLNED